MSKSKESTLSRREFIQGSIAGLACLSGTNLLAYGGKKKAKIALIRTQDRKEGVKEALKLFDFPSMNGRSILIKPNFNTADPFPGSTHKDTLSQLVEEAKKRGAAEITVGERSGPPPTEKVLEEKKILELARNLNFNIINFEDLADEDWIPFKPAGCHWKNGFSLARPVVESEYLLSTCCLKTHQYGGVFTLSLKLSVGATPKNLMRELHRSPDMRKMIAEINLGYTPRLIILDGIEAFVDGGPMKGQKKVANVFLAGDDRVAIDAVGIAVLKELGSNNSIMGPKIFEQEQIMRAVELGLGVTSSGQIDIITQDRESEKYAERIRKILAMG